MPAYESKLILKIFVASPGDLQEERDLAETAIQEINDSYLVGKNYTLKLVKWEKDTYVSYGHHPQFIINRQTAGKYHAILVMFWKRVGTKTPKSISGTVEELQLAAKLRKRNGSPHIMIYFKSAHIHPFDTDLIQLGQVQELRKSLHKQGLTRDFPDRAEFLRALKSDLIKWLDAEIIGKRIEIPRWNGKLARARTVRAAPRKVLKKRKR
jgi:hypothetical protein